MYSIETAKHPIPMDKAKAVLANLDNFPGLFSKMSFMAYFIYLIIINTYNTWASLIQIYNLKYYHASSKTTPKNKRPLTINKLGVF